MPLRLPHSHCGSVLLLTAAMALLAACSPRTAIVGAGSAAVGAVSAAGSAAGSAIGSAGSTVTNAVGSSGRGAQVADAAVPTVQPPAAPPATVRTFRSGIADCLDAIGTERVAATLVSEGWVSAGSAAGGTAAGAAPGGTARGSAFVKDGVRGSIERGQRCSFVAEAVAGPTGRAVALDALRSEVGTDVVPVAPTGQAPCGGYLFDLNGRPARMDFTAAEGGDCTGAGAGVIISLI